MGIFLLTAASRPALGPTQPPIQWVPGLLYLGVKLRGCEADHSPPSSAEVKNPRSSPNKRLGAQLNIKHRENFTTTIIIITIIIIIIII
jgi:hypothetical protein